MPNYKIDNMNFPSRRGRIPETRAMHKLEGSDPADSPGNLGVRIVRVIELQSSATTGLSKPGGEAPALNLNPGEGCTLRPGKTHPVPASQSLAAGKVLLI